MRPVASWASVWLVLSVAAIASAQEPSVETARPLVPAAALTLEAPASCPTSDVLRSEIASLVGRPAADVILPEGLDPHVVIRAEGERFVLEIRDGETQRALRDGSCAALMRAAALIVALRIDADTATLAAATAAEPPAPPPPPDPPPAPATPPRRRHHPYEGGARLGDPRLPRPLPAYALGAGVLVEGGIVPAITASFALDGVLRVDHFEARLRLTYVTEQGQPQSVGVSASAALGTFLACGRPFDARFALALCGGVEAGALFARSYGVLRPGSDEPWTMAGVLGVWLPLIPWQSLDISLGAEVWARLVRPEFDVTGVGVVWTSDPWGARFGLLLHWGL
ncbi:MAG: hypothetical protein U0234_30255 [Sandaracinus sp.]